MNFLKTNQKDAQQAHTHTHNKKTVEVYVKAISCTLNLVQR